MNVFNETPFNPSISLRLVLETLLESGFAREDTT